MSTINGLSNLITPPNPETDGKALGRDQFVRLLMAQLGSQDPTNPLDSHDFVAQLAQFSSVELLERVNTGIESLMVAQAASNQMGTLDLVGRSVSWKSDTVVLPAEGPVSLHADLETAAAEVSVTITDADGNTVRTLQLGPQEAGALEVTWDGLDSEGARLPEGEYSINITATGDDGTTTEVDPLHQGRVHGVTFEDGVARLMVGDESVSLSQILEILES